MGLGISLPGMSNHGTMERDDQGFPSSLSVNGSSANLRTSTNSVGNVNGSSTNVRFRQTLSVREEDKIVALAEEEDVDSELGDESVVSSVTDR